jgi:hypothetical protein
VKLLLLKKTNPKGWGLISGNKRGHVLGCLDTRWKNMGIIGWNNMDKINSYWV